MLFMLEENFVDGKTITFRWSCQINRFCAWMCGMQKHGVEFIVSPRLFFSCVYLPNHSSVVNSSTASTFMNAYVCMIDIGNFTRVQF